MDARTKRKISGIFLLLFGLTMALFFSSNDSGFATRTIFESLAYIGGFVIAFIGVALLIMGRRSREESNYS